MSNYFFDCIFNNPEYHQNGEVSVELKSSNGSLNGFINIFLYCIENELSCKQEPIGNGYFKVTVSKPK